MPRSVRTPRRPRGPEPATRTRLKFIRIFVVVLGLLGLSGISVLFGMMMAVAPQVKGLQAGQEFKTGQNSQLLDRDNRFLAELTGDDGRVILKSNEIAANMKRAVVAIETSASISTRVWICAASRARSSSTSSSNGPRRARRRSSSSS